MKTMIALTVAALLGAPAVAGAEPAASGTQKWIVTFQPKVKRAGRDRALAALDVRAAKHIATDGDTQHEFSAAVVELPKGVELKKGEGLEASLAGDIVSIEKDVKVKWIESAAISFQAAPLPSMADMMGQIGRFQPSKGGRAGAPAAGVGALAVRPELTWGVQRVRAPAAWQNTEGRGVRVAVIDTGIDTSHPDLVGQVDGGYSAIAKSESPAAYQDDNGHGTHVAGTIAARRDDKGVVGVAPQARLYAVKVLDADGSGNLSDVIDGIVWAASNDMQVANMSLGAPFGSETMRRALRFANGRGTIVVAAAGNSSGGSVGYPGAYPEAIAVASADAEDKFSAFSSKGPEVDFIAPGSDVVSTKMGGGFVSYSGTSMAAPHVAGIVALSVAQGWTGLNGPDGVLSQLKKAAKPLAELTAEQQGAGMIDAGKLTR